MPKSQTKQKFAFVADPIAGFDPVAETTSFIMAEICRRGMSSFHVELKNILLKNNDVYGLCDEVIVKRKNGKFVFEMVGQKLLSLAKMDAVFLRKDPPVDLNFIDHLSLLELIADKTLLINHPTWVKHANEKLFTFHFDDLAPRTLVSQNNSIIADFVKKEKTAILKPLNLSGGRGVIRVSGKDPSLNSLIDVLTEHQTRFIMAQEFIPAAKRGDKRILLLDGEVLGSFLRVPSQKDFRGNLHSGAKLVRSKITKHEEKIIEVISPRLSELGLYFVGIDIIGPYVTEINSTSPMGIREINDLDDSQIEKTVVNWLQKKTTRP